MSIFRGIRAAVTGRLRQAVREFSGEADRARERREREEQRRYEEAIRERERARERVRERADERARERERQSRDFFGPPIIPPIGRRREPLPPIETPDGPRTEREQDRIEQARLPIWTTDGRIEWIPARDLSSQERKSLVDYWLNVWNFLGGEQRDIGDWTGGAFQIEGRWIETSLDNIEDTADFVGVPLESDDLYQEI